MALVVVSVRISSLFLMTVNIDKDDISVERITYFLRNGGRNGEQTRRQNGEQEAKYFLSPFRGYE
jgi:hypothetical protein